MSARARKQQRLLSCDLAATHGIHDARWVDQLSPLFQRLLAIECVLTFEAPLSADAWRQKCLQQFVRGGFHVYEIQPCKFDASQPASRWKRILSSTPLPDQFHGACPHHSQHPHFVDAPSVFFD
eukprot:1865378-Amphidinium_carterae.1